MGDPPYEERRKSLIAKSYLNIISFDNTWAQFLIEKVAVKIYISFSSVIVIHCTIRNNVRHNELF